MIKRSLISAAALVGFVILAFGSGGGGGNYSSADHQDGPVHAVAQ